MKTIIFILFSTLSSMAQDFDSILQFDNTPQTKYLVDSLTKIIENDSLKILIIYDWIANNIKFNIPAYIQEKDSLSKHKKPIILKSYKEKYLQKGQDCSSVLKSRLAFCSGYSYLFISMLKHIEISAFYVSGYAKNNDFDIGDNHAWVMYIYKNKYFLSDPTWASSVPEKYSIFKINPKEFIKTHCSEDPAFQLIDYPINIAEFKAKSFNYSKTKVNFKSELEKFVRSSDINKVVHSNKRALEFNPEIHQILRNLADIYALQLYNDLVKFDSNNKFINNSKNVKEEIFRLLNSIEKKCTEILFLNKKQKLHDIELTENVLQNISSERKSLVTLYNEFKLLK
jgi:transglutaminase/protease-like cytokinesis protein 3